MTFFATAIFFAKSEKYDWSVFSSSFKNNIITNELRYYLKKSTLFC